MRMMKLTSWVVLRINSFFYVRHRWHSVQQAKGWCVAVSTGVAGELVSASAAGPQTPAS